MRATLISGIFATVASIAMADASSTAPVHDINITADVPTVTVSPRQAGRTTMRLPGLTYEISVTVNCETNWQPDSVSISVADSRASISAEELQASKELSLQLRIPSNQIAPLRVEHFCVDGGADDPDAVSTNSIKIPGVVSAQASLRCSTESTNSMMYVSKPLDVLLECTVPEQAVD